MESETSVRTLFRAFKSQQESLESSTAQPSSAAFQEKLQAAISTLDECRRLVDQSSLFSPNETEDDITSGDLQYLQIDYHLAELILRNNILDRRSVLKKAQDAYGRFLSLLETYCMLSKPDYNLYERYLDNKNTFSLMSSTDPATRRETKISRFKQESQLKSKLEHLAHDPSALQNDDAAQRDLHLAEIKLHTHNTFHALDLIGQELAILSLGPPTTVHPSSEDSSTSDRRQRNGSVLHDAYYSDRLDPSLSQLLRTGKAGPILSKDGKPLQPFTLLDNRQRLRNGVFRPDHNLPTMTIDEYLAEEKRRGGIVNGGGEQSGMAAEPDEDDYARADMETVKAREWDEFKEDNPRGSGNTLNRG